MIVEHARDTAVRVYAANNADTVVAFCLFGSHALDETLDSRSDARPPSLRLVVVHTSKRQNMMSEILASLGYEAKVVATGTDEVQRVLAELEAGPSKGKLQYDTSDGEFIYPSTRITGSADVTMATRTSVPHFVDLLSDQYVNELVRITPMMAQNEYGHRVALGPDGFFLCTCLKQLIDGLGCRHGLKAMQGKDVSFNGACIAPRWRDSEKPWTMAALAAKPARLATVGAGGPEQPPPTGAIPDVFTHSNTTVRATVYANAVTFGKDLAALSKDLAIVDGSNRVLEKLKNHAKQLIAVEVVSQKHASTVAPGGGPTTLAGGGGMKSCERRVVVCRAIRNGGQESSTTGFGSGRRCILPAQRYFIFPRREGCSLTPVRPIATARRASEVCRTSTGALPPWSASSFNKIEQVRGVGDNSTVDTVNIGDYAGWIDPPDKMG